MLKKLSLMLGLFLALIPTGAHADPAYINYIDSSANISLGIENFSLQYFVHYSDQESLPIITKIGQDSQGNLNPAKLSSMSSSLCSEFISNIYVNISGEREEISLKSSSLQVLTPSSSVFGNLYLDCLFINSTIFSGSHDLYFADKNQFNNEPGIH